MAFVSQAAWADLTAAQVWGDWRQYLEGMGYTLNATEKASGGALTVSDMTLGFVIPDDAGSMSMTLGTVILREQGDGSVAVVMPETMPITMTATEGSGPGDSFTMKMDYTQSGHQMTVSGDPAQMTYNYAASSAMLSLRALIAEGKSYGPENARFDITAKDFTTTTTMTLGDMRGYDQTGSMSSASYDVFINNPEDANQVSLTGNIEAVAMQGASMIPLRLANAADMSAMIKAGFQVSALIRYGSGTSAMMVTDPKNGDVAIKTNSQGGHLSVKMGADGLGYGGGQNDLNVVMNVAALPFPVELNMGEGAFNLSLPVTKADAPQDFAFGVTLGDFQMSDMIWSIFDPTAQLPRDPATLVIDLAGKVKVLLDYLDPKVAESLGKQTPAEVQSVAINRILLDAVGARFEGSGDLTLDNTDKTTFPGFPKPVGSISFTLDGANALIDKLVSMGLIPADQAMMPRMMMGMITVPNDGPDSLKSTIDLTADGQVLANGQRIK
ncbi:MAG: hypothetical protein ACJAVM_001152 [Sulfitobacter sp.]|jgi:hypothetical protein